jgi:ubiquinone/menaquinone biosynthesis C-methylase UbiE
MGTLTTIDPATEKTRRTYDRASRFYDIEEGLMDRLAAGKWRAALWNMVPPDAKVLEIGVGTGRNFKYYRPDLAITGIDISPKMLAKAERKAAKDDVRVDLRLMDAQALEFPDQSFDVAISTFVFCSVPDPVLGLEEARRVIRPGGRLLLLEHVLPRWQPARWLMQRANSIARTISGANINRATVANVESGGWAVEEVQHLWADIVKIIVARRTG